MSNAHTILILGGARSGKTRRALTLAEPYAQKSYIATAEALDAEMAERIAHHRGERGPEWETLEAPLNVAGTLRHISGGVAVVDCLTLWLSNLIFSQRDIAAETEKLAAAIMQARADLVLVSNEVGLGLVPDTTLGRNFRDAQGRLNQAMAKIAGQVEFMAAGLSLRLKP